MVKLCAKRLLYGVVGGCFLFVIYGLLFDFFGIELIPYFHSAPTVNAIAFVILGMGFAGGSLVYETELLSFPLKLVAHVVVGVGIFLVVAVSFGWLYCPVELAIGSVLSAFALVGVWIMFYIRDKKEMAAINQLIAARNKTQL